MKTGKVFALNCIFKRSKHYINAECFLTIYVEMEVKERCLHYFMPQLLVFHVSEDTNTQKRQSMFQMLSVYICKYTYLWQLKA